MELESKSYNILPCMECKKRRADIKAGSFLCTICFEKHADYLRQKYGKRKEKQSEYEYWLQIALNNGIPKHVFSNRINLLEMEFERAATQPVRKVNRQRNKRIINTLAKEGIEISKWQIYTLVRNGITDEKEIIDRLRERYGKARAVN